MAGQIIDGKAVAASIRQQLAKDAEALKKDGVVPGLAVVLVGDDPASKVYVRQKEVACDEAGFYSEKTLLPASVSQDELLDVVSKLNDDPKIDGILVQLPLPGHIDSNKVLEAINPLKDIDGFHPTSVGRLVSGEDSFVSCTPQGIMVLLESVGVDPAGKEAVVVGRSNIVGKPVSLLLLHKNATVTICHSKTKDLAFHTRRADILIVAVGRPRIITGDMVKEGAVVIDVGVNRVDGRLVGDVDFDTASEKAAAITPVPGGVGPMTIAMLMKNTLIAARRRKNLVTA